MRTIGGLFGRSAWGPLWEHLEKSKECIDHLKDCIEEFISGDMDKVRDLSKKVAKLEKDADTIKENIRSRLSRSIFSTVERSEIMAWLRQQDGIADSCEDAAKLLSLRRTKVIGELVEPLRALVDRTKKMAEDLVKAVKIFDSMQVNEVSQAQIKELTEIIDETQKGKDDVDTMQMELLETLFKSEHKMDPVSIFFLRDIADKIARVADRIENVGDIIRHMLIK